VRIAINTDAHAVEQLDYMGLGVTVARRAWLRTQDVLNTLPYAQLRRVLRR
jgi:DNA polymerase (family 10)